MKTPMLRAKMICALIGPKVKEGKAGATKAEAETSRVENVAAQDSIKKMVTVVTGRVFAKAQPGRARSAKAAAAAKARNNKRKRALQLGSGQLIRLEDHLLVEDDGSSLAPERASFPPGYTPNIACPAEIDTSLVGKRVLHLWKNEGEEKEEWKVFNAIPPTPQ